MAGTRTIEREAPAAEPAPVPMRDAVGYDRVDCTHEMPVSDALVLKNDRVFLLTDHRGDIAPPGRCALGLFRDDTRYLSHYALRTAGNVPSLLSTQVPRPFRAQVDLAVDNLAFGGDPWDPKNAVHIRRAFLLDEHFAERLTLTNYLVRPIDFWVSLGIGCDFADIFEVRGWKRAARGTFIAPRVERDRVVFGYRGRDGRMLHASVRFDPPPTSLGKLEARWEMRLEPKQPFTIMVEVVPEETAAAGEENGGEDIPAAAAFTARRDTLEARYVSWRADCARWSSDAPIFDAMAARAVDDLRALYTEADGARVVSAGIPWYSTIFGRDSIITSLETLPVNPGIAKDTLRYLARRQGEHEDPFTEEQPGKILHELRRGEMARAGEIPHVPYYGTIDATPLWIVLLHETWRWTGDEALVRELLPHAERALAWIDRYGDIDGDGLVEYARTSEKGLVNQGWKDSGDGVPFPDGTLPRVPIALVEVQGYVYDAKVRAALLFKRFGDPARAAQLREEAARLRKEIVRRFWMEEEGTFALALDGDKRPVPTVTTNAGHLLWSRVPDVARARKLGARMLAPDMFSGWGIRTLSASHPVYNPMSYHDGSIWPHDNALVLLGMAHYGLVRDALPVVTSLYEAAANMEFLRLPELFCGMTREGGQRPVLYPVSCSPQAWASGAIFMLLQGLLGLFPEAADGVLHVRDPQLPPFANELTVDGLRIGRSRVALQFRRHGRRTLANLLGVEGDPLQVRIELS